MMPIRFDVYDQNFGDDAENFPYLPDDSALQGDRGVICATERSQPMPEQTTTNPIARRQFLRRVLSGAVTGAVVAGIEVALPRPLLAQTPLTPDAALRELMAGNERFDNNQLTSLEHDLRILKDNTVEKQEPFAAVLACADSRVPIELVFDQTIGHIFVTRIAGNIVTPETVASLEYGVAVLGVKALLVLGHTGCGAVKAAMKADAVPGQISALYQYIQSAVEHSGGDFEQAIAHNANFQANLLRTSSTVVRDALKAGKVRVDSGVYDLATGKVTLQA
jgi:carbonic anhydrase